MDNRSFELNFEINAVIYSEEISIKQRKAFEDDLLESVELTAEEYNNRTLWVRIKAGFSRLFSGVL